MRSLRQIASESALSIEQLRRIEDIIISRGNYSKTVVREEIDWFCTGLGMNPYYFETTPLKTIANHIEAVKAAEIMASVQKEKNIKIDLATERKDEAIYLVDDYHYRALEVEKRIEKKYPNFRLESHRTLGKALGLEHLRMYLVYRPRFSKEKVDPEETDLKRIACKDFLKTAMPETLQRYQGIINKSRGWETPLIEMTRKKEPRELRFMIAVKRDSGCCFFSNISDVIHSHGLVSTRKYVEQFANGKTVYAFYVADIEDERKIQRMVEDISLIYVIPESPLSPLFRNGKLNAQETVFGVSAWSFAHQFLTEYNEEYTKLLKVLKDSPELLGLTGTLKTKLAKETYDEARIWEALVNHHQLLKKAFSLFNKKFNPSLKAHDIQKQRDELEKEIGRKTSVEVERNIFRAVLLFIEMILRTNFYKEEKTSVAFMYSPDYLNEVDYPVKPFGIFHVISMELRGFHIRFRDIARGGVRIVRSQTFQNFLNNSDFIFDENYNLALTQQMKNKDIPEGGSKGTILLSWEAQDQGEGAFKKYVNGLLDLLLPDKDIVNYYEEEVILFLGPDEGTADLMAWAAKRAKVHEYPYWKAFSTGKPQEMGGIPHDLYGMTTNSIHEYVLKILEKKGLKEAQITKVMTGGPDGDLGSNEILISKDKILALIDGSGVLYDPKGINRVELNRLARKRKMVENFNKQLISPKGFLVTMKDRNLTLPDGEKVVSGLEFRNSFHLHPQFKADLFIPCGGRPASININNWTELIDARGGPRFKFIVEGANLFLTQAARLRLEEKGVIIYKDASANKGGVTSSSLEVFVSLALTDEEYEELMCVKDRVVPVFRQKYIQGILEIIRQNARLEFEVIWKENALKNIPRSTLSDLISGKINQIKDAIYSSELFSDEELFGKVIKCCCPEVLIQQIGFEKILERVPLSYLKAIFASRLASRYVYRYGLDANEVDFFEFIKEYK